MGKRRSDRAEFWKGHVEAIGTSGLRVGEYCKRHGLAPAAFYKWRYKLKGARETRLESGQLVPVQVVPARRQGAETSFRVSLPTHGSVEISGDFGAVVKIIQLLRWEGV